MANPREAYIDKVKLHLTEAPHYGEAIMQEMIGLMCTSDDLLYNARPKFLINPRTGERMEFDCYFFKLGVAVEFDGPQHDGPTELYPDEEAAKQQQERDMLKRKYCEDRVINFITIRSEDLSFETLHQKLGNLLPLRNLQSWGSVIDHLEKVCEKYRQDAKSWTNTDPKAQKDEAELGKTPLT
jgi:hypothetical protein